MVGASRLATRPRIAATLACLCVAPGATAAATRPSSDAFTAFDLLSMRQIGGEAGSLSLSPDGGEVAFQVRETRFDRRSYDLAWFVARVDGQGTAVRIADGGEVSFYPPTFGRVSGALADVKSSWSPDGKWIAFLRRERGEAQVWRASADGSRQEAVTESPADVLDFQWREDGKAIVFRVGPTREQLRAADAAQFDNGYLLDDRFAPTYSFKPLSFDCDDRFAGIRPPSSQPCGSRLRVAEFGGAPERAANDDEAHGRSGAGDSYRPPSGREARNVTWDSSHRHVAWLENETPEESPGFAAELTLYADRRRCELPECRGKLHGLWWSDRGRDVLFQRSEGHAHSVHAVYVWRPDKGSVQPVYKVDGYLQSCELARGKLVCIHETARTPRKIIAIDVAVETASTIYDPNPQFHSFKLGHVEKLEWLDAFGNPTFGHLVYPSDYVPLQRYPLVVVQYRSRGFLSGGVGNEYPIFPLAERGFLVLSFDRPEDDSLFARHRADTLEEFAALLTATHGDAYTHRQALSALQAIADTLCRRGLIDPERIGITGLSNGAETVDYALTHSNLFAAAAVSGNGSPLHYYQEMSSSVRDLVRATYRARDGQEVLENGRTTSIVHRAAMVQAPLLIQVSDRELVPAVPLIVALQEARKPVEAYVFADEYHIKWQPRHKLAVAERAIDWFRFWLKSEDDPNAAKAQQYQRWRALRALQSDYRD